MSGRHATLRTILVVAALVLGSLTARDAAADVSTLMHLDGIVGGSLLDGYAGWIEIDGYATAVQNSTSLEAAGSGRGGAKPSFSFVEVTKVADQADASLFTKVVTGAVIPTGCLLSYARLAQEIVPISAIGLGDVVVTNLSPATAPGGIPQQSVSLGYQKISIIKYTIDPGSGEVTGVEASCWDAKAGKSCGTGPSALLGCPGVP